MKRVLLLICSVILIGLMLSINTRFLATIDSNILLFFEEIRTNKLNNFVIVITQLGSIKVLLPMSIIVSIPLLMNKRFVDCSFLWITFLSSRWGNHLIKNWLERERPSFHPLIDVSDYSFPSGHAMNSTAVYGFLFYLLVHLFHWQNKQKLASLSITILLIVAIGISRVYLGVHYFTDVLAGISAGFIIVFCISQFHHYITKTFSDHVG